MLLCGIEGKDRTREAFAIGVKYAVAEPTVEGGLQHQLQVLLSEQNDRASDPEFLVRLAGLYLEIWAMTTLSRPRSEEMLMKKGRELRVKPLNYASQMLMRITCMRRT